MTQRAWGTARYYKGPRPVLRERARIAPREGFLDY